MPPSDQQYDQTLGLWEGGYYSASTHNISNDITSIVQPGGFILLSTRKSLRKIIKSGKDRLNLDYWVQMKCRGKNEILVRLILAYQYRDNKGSIIVYS